jgi:NAD-dependent deacetylase
MSQRRGGGQSHETTDDVAEAGALLGDLLARPGRVVALTGAGASAASGVPTYRGAGGSWTRYDPAKYASIDYFREDPSYYWRFFRDERYPALAEAQPNPVHAALAALERSGSLAALVTQNIDGLHQAAGSSRVLELHGNSRRFLCEACGAAHDMASVRSLVDRSIPPICPACSAASLRPDVVLFGEALPPAVLSEALEEMRAASLVLVVGSSLVVQPAAALPLHALQAGAALVILNIDSTPLDDLACLVVRAAADLVLPLALEHAGIHD